MFSISHSKDEGRKEKKKRSAEERAMDKEGKDSYAPIQFVCV